MSSRSDLTLRIEHDGGGTSTLTVPTPVAIDSDDVTLASIRIERALDRVGRAEARVFRPDWLDVLGLVDRRNDQAFIDRSDGTTIFGGRLDDWQFEARTASVLIDSFETDALDTTPPSSFSRSSASDDSIASDIINLVADPVSVGTIDQTTASIDFDETHTSPGRLLRLLGRDTGAEVAYRADGSVDYLTERGATRTETLSPSSGALVGEPRLRQTVREDVTDVRVISQSDATVFEESSVTSSGRTVYSTDTIDSTSTSRLQARANSLASEYDSAPEYIEIEAAVDPLARDEALDVGDTVPVALPQYGIDEDLRVIETERTIDEGGELINAVLSNRKQTLSGRDGPLAV